MRFYPPGFQVGSKLPGEQLEQPWPNPPLPGPSRAFTILGGCAITVPRGTCREARVCAGHAGARSGCPGRSVRGIVAGCVANATKRCSTGRRFAILPSLFPAAGIAALQADLSGLRVLHVLRGLLLICCEIRPPVAPEAF